MRYFTRMLRLVALMLLSALSLLARNAVDPSGHWEGTISAPNMDVKVGIDLAMNAKGQLAGTFSQPNEGKQMRIILTMANHADGTATGTIVSPDGSGVEVPVAMTQKASSLTVEASSVGASFASILNAAGTELTGTWTQGPSTLPLTLKRAK